MPNDSERRRFGRRGRNRSTLPQRPRSCTHAHSPRRNRPPTTTNSPRHRQHYRMRHPHLNHTSEVIKGLRHAMALTKEPCTVATIRRLLVPQKNEPRRLFHEVPPAWHHKKMRYKYLTRTQQNNVIYIATYITSLILHKTIAQI